MEFSSLFFIFLFFPVFIFLFFILKKESHNSFLLIVSFIFYYLGEGRFLLVLLLSIIVNYILGLCIQKSNSKKISKYIFILGIVFNVGLLILFKYTNFLVNNINVLFTNLGLKSLYVSHIHLPIGISFFTFFSISYIVDVYRKTSSAEKNPLNFALYISFFPKLITGPITLYHKISSQILKRNITIDGFSYGVKRFIIGLGKKILIADTLAPVVNQIFSIPSSSQTVGLAWLGIICYTLQIYFDFSGYTDMAIGIGRMLGFKFVENFNYPYFSKSIKDFWRRWHISLANWLQTYLFLPIAYKVMRKIKSDRFINIKVENWAYYIGAFFTMLLCGIWHGASWTFVFWGAYYGIFLVIEHAGLGKFIKSLYKPFRILYAQMIIMIGWVFFRSENMAYAFDYLKAMFGFGKGNGVEYYTALYLNPEVKLFIIIGILGSFPLFPKLKSLYEKLNLKYGTTSKSILNSGYSILYTFYLIFVFVLSSMSLALGTYNPFIYFRF